MHKIKEVYLSINAINVTSNLAHVQKVKVAETKNAPAKIVSFKAEDTVELTSKKLLLLILNLVTSLRI